MLCLVPGAFLANVVRGVLSVPKIETLALTPQGKLCLVRELVGALDRLGVGLGANGRPGLISILLNR